VWWRAEDPASWCVGLEGLLHPSTVVSALIGAKDEIGDCGASIYETQVLQNTKGRF